MTSQPDRRSFLMLSGMMGTSLLVDCRKEGSPTSEKTSQLAQSVPSAKSTAEAKRTEENDEPEVSAVEDLMREHGVIRRALVVYREAGARLRAKPSGVPADALQKTAKLLRSFAEDYHEKKLEEMHIFPAVKRAGGPAARDVDTLIAQHNRGREITDYVITSTAGTIAVAKAEPLARTLDAFCRMYEEHAALEDTILFPAWKRTMSAKQLDEMGDLFEDIEQKTFGKDGFDDAVDQIEAIERAFGFELAQFTAPPPPKA
jgi:hemerythrin-like domain-containing protein